MKSRIDQPGTAAVANRSTHLTRLDEILRTTTPMVMAIDPLGADFVPVPEFLGVTADRHIVGAGPLDHFTSTSAGPAVIAFEQARRTNHGVARVTRVDSTTPDWLEIFDLTDDHDCFVAVVFGGSGEDESHIEPAQLPPRRTDYRLTPTGVVIDVAPTFEAMLGHPADEIVGTASMALIHPDDHEVNLVAWVELLETPGSMNRFRSRFKPARGGWIWCEVTTINRLHEPDPHIVSELVDISREVAAETALQRRETVLDRLKRALPTGVLVLEPDGTIAAVNERWDELLDAPAGLGLEALLRRVPDRARLRRAIDQSIEDRDDRDLAVDFDDAGWCRHGDLRLRPLDEDGHDVGLLVTLDDATAAKLHAAELASQLRRDVLTGVLNRRGLADVLEDRFVSGGYHSVLFVDIDDFKTINDTLGHSVGDQVLCAVATSLVDQTPEESIVSRLGGDEFLIVLDDTTDVDDVVSRIAGAIDELRARFGLSEGFGVTCGCAERRDGDDFDSLIARADRAMYAAKPQNRRCHDRN